MKERESFKKECKVKFGNEGFFVRYNTEKELVEHIIMGLQGQLMQGDNEWIDKEFSLEFGEVINKKS